MSVASKDFLSFNDGTCDIYTVSNTAERGDMPVEGLILKYTLRFPLAHGRNVALL